MRIDRTSGTGTPSVRRKSGSSEAASGGFGRSLQEASAEGSTGVTGGGGIGGMDALLALQEVPDSVAERSKAQQNGQRILDRLEQLRFELLEGRIAPETLERLSSEVEAARSRTDDPQLNEILDEIDLRAQVEMAKLGR
jgi:hypothetical protein